MARKTVLNLALQGGRAHGAFTWGVLDRLLEEPDLGIGRISGTSAGALNGAKKQLALFWNQVAATGLPLAFLLFATAQAEFGHLGRRVAADLALPRQSAGHGPIQAHPQHRGGFRCLEAVVGHPGCS